MGNVAGKAAGILGQVSPIGGAVLGAIGERRERKAARREAEGARQQLAQQQSAARAEQSRLNASLAASQNKVNAGRARSNRARIRGGIFREAEPTQANLNPRLG